VVYKAQDTRTGEMVAMKKLKFPDLQEDDDMIQDIKEEFEKEIQLLANLRHKNESRQNNFVLII
jgi:serine/threonine protein kinase